VSAGEVLVCAVVGAVAGGALLSALVPYLRQVCRERARFLDDEPRNGRESTGMAGDPLEFVADAGSMPPGPSRPPRSNAVRKVANTGEVFAHAAASLSDCARVDLFRDLTSGIPPIRAAYFWATAFGRMCTLSLLFFVASVVAIFGDYPRIFLAATILSSLLLVGIPAFRLHRVAWQALNVSVGVYAIALKGDNHVDE